MRTLLACLPLLLALPCLAATPLQHVIIIMQENRSFDSYFGTFPGADGLRPGTCIPINPANTALGCIAPYHDPHDANAGGPHDAPDAQADLDDGISHARMDGFIYQQDLAATAACPFPDAPGCGGIARGVTQHDVMGYHTNAEIPNYWAYASNFVLQDHLFEGVRSWSLPSHLDLVSEWSALCTDHNTALSCTTAPNADFPIGDARYPWANLFHLLDAQNVMWKYYLGEGPEPDCADGALTCDPQVQTSTVASIWNPPPYFAWVQAQGPAYLQLHNPPIEQFLEDIRQGTLPAVSWIVPSQTYSEHPPAGVTAGMMYVTSLVNAVMESPYWKNTAIFITWDDWGGFYDHVPPINVDTNTSATPIQGWGLRVPGIMISAYARRGIDPQLFSFDSYATFIEDLFLGGQRLVPTVLSNPDHRPTVRDALRTLKLPNGTVMPVGQFINEFDFTQPPRPPLILTTHIPAHIQVFCRGNAYDGTEPCTQPSVIVSWDPITVASTSTQFVYHVTRDGQALPSCVTSSTSCTDQPGSGSHLYRVQSVDEYGLTSPISAAAEAMMP